jgi:hypothetical protein
MRLAAPLTAASVFTTVLFVASRSPLRLNSTSAEWPSFEDLVCLDVGHALDPVEPLGHIGDRVLELRIGRLERLGLDKNGLTRLLREGVVQDPAGLAGLAGHAGVLIELLLRDDVEADDECGEY